ncbi:lanthionine synthetase C family protein [Ktedonosporobacter rubrisoli]|nr:lanthionine synthetase C family protein [Ktedonosporobacter rubrisoli]
MQHQDNISSPPTSNNFVPRTRTTRQSLLDNSLHGRALETLHLIAERMRDPALLFSTAARAREQIKLDRAFSWGRASFNHLGSLALLYLSLARSFPDEGWEESAHKYLRLAAQRSQQTPLVTPGLYNGSSGLALVVAAFCQEEPRYRRTLEALNEQISRQVLDLSLPTAIAQSSMGTYDVINGAAGILGYLCSLPEPPSHVQEAIDVLIHYLIWLGGEEKPGHPNWLIAPEWLNEHDQALYPNGNYNLGLAHGIPGPLAALSLAWQAGYHLPGQQEAIEHISSWIRASAISDTWGINWPGAIPYTATHPWEQEMLPTRAAWCYGAPGIAASLRLAGEALGDEELCQMAVTSLETVYRRPAEAIGLISPIVCHGIAGLVAIGLRFAQVSSSQMIRDHIPLQVAQILAACHPDAPLIVRDQEIPGNFVDDPSFLTGAVGVALVLLAASSEVEPAWDRILMIA